jgi:hypothetical protein
MQMISTRRLESYVSKAIDRHLEENPEESISDDKREILTEQIINMLEDSLREMVDAQMERWSDDWEYDEFVNDYSDYFTEAA